VIRWAQGIERHGCLDSFLADYQQAKKGPRKKRITDVVLKRRIWEIWKKYHHCCEQKIQYFLEKDSGVRVSVTTIYIVLKEKYQLRSKWQKNQKRGPVPSVKVPREVIQMDTVDFGGVFAFTAIDKRVMFCCGHPLKLLMVKLFYITACPDVLMGLSRLFKRMEEKNLKRNLRQMFPSTVTFIGLPGLTRKMNKVI